MCCWTPWGSGWIGHCLPPFTCHTVYGVSCAPWGVSSRQSGASMPRWWAFDRGRSDGRILPVRQECTAFLSWQGLGGRSGPLVEVSRPMSHSQLGHNGCIGWRHNPFSPYAWVGMGTVSHCVLILSMRVRSNKVRSLLITKIRSELILQSSRWSTIRTLLFYHHSNHL